MAKTRVDEPCHAYDSLADTWKKCRAFAHSQSYVKSADVLPLVSNYLIPFSPSMSVEQYNFYKAEAELPGITGQFIKTIIGGLLRKPPQLSYKVDLPSEVIDWINSSVTIDGNSLISFLEDILNEEMQTSRGWVYVDYPNIPLEEQSTKDVKQWLDIKPYLVMWQAEAVINWQTQIVDGNRSLSRVIVRGTTEKFKDPLDFHPDYIDTIWVHEIIDGAYQIRIFEINAPVEPKYTDGQTQPGQGTSFEHVDTLYPLMYGERMKFIPAYPVNGSVDPCEPFITTFVDKEQALYNVISRRNHLLYGAATYTPWIASDMPDKDFETIVDQGLGTWIRLRQGDTIGSLTPPTEALKDLESAILNKLDELAKLGIRFLAPETAESGVALTIRSATQVATLGTLNTRVSETMSAVIAHLINRRFNTQLLPSDVIFNLSPDFDPTAIGEGYLRLVTEWYTQGLIPRNEWIRLLKANEMLSPEYDDEAAIDAINEDELVQANAQQQDAGLSTATNMKNQQDMLKE